MGWSDLCLKRQSKQLFVANGATHQVGHYKLYKNTLLDETATQMKCHMFRMYTQLYRFGPHFISCICRCS